MNIQSLINFVPSLGRTGVSIEIKELSVFVFVDRNGLRLGLRLCCSCFFLIFDYFYVSMVSRGTVNPLFLVRVQVETQLASLA